MKQLIQTKPYNCGQTALSMFLSHYDIDETPDEIEENIKIHYDENKIPLGSATPDYGLYLLSKKFPCTMEVFDANYFDRTLVGKSQEEILASCKIFYEKGKAFYVNEHKNIYLQSYIEFMENGGRINISFLTKDSLMKALDNGPVFTTVQAQYLQTSTKTFYDNPNASQEEKNLFGRPTNHFIVLEKYINDTIIYFDPDPVDKKTVIQDTSFDIMIGAIMAAQVESDNVIIYCG